MQYHPQDGIMDTLTGALAPVKHIIEDPALPSLVNRVSILHSLEQKPSKPGAPKGPEVPGIGLSSFIKPLDYYIFAKRNPWVVPTVLVAAVGGLLMIGFKLGSR